MAPAYSASPEVPSPTWEAKAGAERSRAARQRRRRRTRLLRRLTELEVEDTCEGPWGMTVECGEGSGGAGDGSGGSGSSGDDGSSGSGWLGDGGSTDTGDSCPLLAVCWEEPGSTDPGASTDPGSTDTSDPVDTTGSTDTSGSTDPAGSCPTNTSCLGEPESEPAPQPDPKSQPDSGSATDGIHINPLPVYLKPMPADAAGANCGLSYQLDGDKQGPMGVIMGPGRGDTLQTCGGPKLIPLCVHPLSDGSCPEPPQTLGEFQTAKRACMGAEESGFEAEILAEIADSFSVDINALGLPAKDARSRAVWDANQCDKVWQGYR